jgi:hypothetical protein
MEGQGRSDGELAAGVARDLAALLVDNPRQHAEERAGGGAGLGRRDPGERGDHDGARFRLPPGVDDRAFLFADQGVIPHPGLGVDGLADGTEQAERIEAVAKDVIVAPAHEGADGGGGRVEDGQPVAVDHLPEAIGLRAGWGALVEEDGRAVREQAVDDVAVAGDPADVGRAEIAVGLLEVEDVVRAELRPEQVARGGVQHALGFAGGAGGVEDEERVLGVEGLCVVVVRARLPRPPPPGVAALDHVDGVAAALDDEHRLHVGVAATALVDVGLELDDLAAAPAAVGGDDERAWQSLMRSLIASALKPPKMTVWTAPMRAQASMAIIASGIIGR